MTVKRRCRCCRRHRRQSMGVVVVVVAWGPAFVPCPCPHPHTAWERQRTRRTPQHGGESARARQHHVCGTIGSAGGSGWLAARASGLPLGVDGRAGQLSAAAAGDAPPSMASRRSQRGGPANGCRAAIRLGGAMPALSHPERCSAHPPASTLHHPFSQQRRRRGTRFFRWLRASHAADRPCRWTCLPCTACRPLAPRARCRIPAALLDR